MRPRRSFLRLHAAALPSAALAALALLDLPAAAGADATRQGRLIVDPPTFNCLGFAWEIEGDANHNATVAVEFRRNGEPPWRPAQPLLRTGGVHVGRAPDWLDHRIPDLLAGSIFDLEPNTAYEVRLTLQDSDGVEGESLRTCVVRTRAEPRPAIGGRVYHVFPPGRPARADRGEFGNFYQAYYGGAGNLGDFNVVWERPVEPGDTILVHAGVYRANLRHYVDPLALVPDGTYWLTAKGTPDRPITIQAAGDGEVIFDGAGADVLFNVMAADYHTFEGITFRNCGTAIFAGQQRMIGCKGLTVRRCRFLDVREGIFTLFNGAEDFLIEDCVFEGRNARDVLTGWGSAADGFFKSNTAITLQGTGHVVRHNRIAWFWQGIHFGTAFQGFDRGGVACDLHDNDLWMLIDDGIEIDGCVRNVRVLRNRVLHAGSAFSAQPVYGGPAYFIRNAAYNSKRTAFKFHEAHPSGLVALHNTMVGGYLLARGLYSNLHFRNNLYLPLPVPAGHPPRSLVAFPDPLGTTTSDYNGYAPDVIFRSTPVDPTTPILDKSRLPWRVLRPYPDPATEKTVGTLADLQAATALEPHSVTLDFRTFRQLHPESLGPLPAVEQINPSRIRST